jgi:hypothetical protein
LGSPVSYNAGLVRQGASLLVITVNGDSADDASPQTVDWYANQFLSIKGVDLPEMFSWSYLSNSGLGSASGNVEFDLLPARIASMEKLVGRIAVDTTQASWWSTVSSELPSAVVASALPLGGAPIVSTISVYLDGPPPGQTMPGQMAGILLQATNPNGSWNWQYDASTNSLMINPSSFTFLPTDTLYVAYTLACN